MKHNEKVEKFLECINEAISESDMWDITVSNRASLKAYYKYNLNAASCEDQSAWWDAVSQR